MLEIRKSITMGLESSTKYQYPTPALGPGKFKPNIEYSQIKERQ